MRSARNLGRPLDPGTGPGAQAPARLTQLFLQCRDAVRHGEAKNAWLTGTAAWNFVAVSECGYCNASLRTLEESVLNPDVPGPTPEPLLDEPLRDFAWQLFAGVMEFRPQLDEQIQAVAHNWKLSRMAGTDRNTLRLGAFELIQTNTPLRVVINEALELARKYGSDQSAQFVNGVLDKLIPVEKRTRGDSDGESAAEPAADQPL